MHLILMLLLVFIPTLYAKDHEVQYGYYQRMLMPQTLATNYLFNIPMRRSRNPFLHSTNDASSPLISFDQFNSHSRRQTKRILWENLNFHAAEFNSKFKKV